MLHPVNYVLQEHADVDDATSSSLDIPPNLFNDAAGILGNVYDEPAAVHSQAMFPPSTDIDSASQGLFDDPEIPLQVLLSTRLHVHFRVIFTCSHRNCNLRRVRQNTTSFIHT